MSKYVQFIFVLFYSVCISACGGSGSSTPSSTQIYVDLNSVVIAPPPANHVMGGAVQGTPLVLSNTVTTLAGTPGSTGFANYSGATGTSAAFNQPNDITTDGVNFYVADYGSNIIHRISPAGVVTTLKDAVTGLPLYFNRPSGITTAGNNLYVVNSGSNTISIVNITTKAVTTIGSTTAGSVDVNAPLATTDTTQARFNQPTGITTDGIRLYVTDSGNHTIRQIDIATKAVSTVAGSSGSIGSSDGIQGAARFNVPNRITTDGASLYVTDFGNRSIRKVNIQTGTVSTLAGSSGPLGTDNGTIDGTGTAARFNQPNGITTDGTKLYITDSYRNSIRVVHTTTGVTSTMLIPVNSLHTPIGITTDGVSLFVTDTYTVERNPTTYNDTYTYSNSILKIQ